MKVSKNIVSQLLTWSFAIFVSLSLSSCGYNAMVGKEEAANKAWSDVQNQYKRRADLIGSIVATVKGEANFEKSTLTAVIEARASATSIKIDPKDLTPEKLQQFQGAQTGLSAALGRLLVVSENYPNLKANQAFQDLRAEIVGTENRIAVARRTFNEAVQDFNTTIREFPNNLFAGTYGFSKKAYFEAEPGLDKAPNVDLLLNGESK
jgi:LemA protein